MEVVVKRPFVVALAALCVITVIAGCSESADATAASQQIKKGNATYKAQSEEFADLADLVEKFFARYAAGTVDDDAAVREMAGYRARMQALLNQVADAQGSYQKARAMKAPGVYKEYAQLRLDMLSQMVVAGGIINKTFPLIEKEIQTGKPPDKATIEGAKRALIGAEMELSFVEVQATELAKDDGLKVK
jgi:hypothetical protein